MLGLMLYLLAGRPEPVRTQPTWEPVLAPAIVVKAPLETAPVEVAEPAQVEARPALKLAPARTVARPKAARRRP